MDKAKGEKKRVPYDAQDKLVQLRKALEIIISQPASALGQNT